jgi:hypothetical protein
VEGRTKVSDCVQCSAFGCVHEFEHGSMLVSKSEAPIGAYSEVNLGVSLRNYLKVCSHAG